MKALPIALFLACRCLFVSASAFAEQPPALYDVEVGPWRLEAEEFVWSLHVTIWDDATASGGKVVKRPGYKYILLNDLPFPRTSRPVTIYLRVRPAMLEERYQLFATDEKGNKKPLTRMMPKSEQINKWQWLKFDPVSAGMIGDKFDIELTRDFFGETALDAVVISTQPDLSEKALDAAPILSTTKPLAAVSRTLTPPELDGLDNDPCWRQAIGCEGFSCIGSQRVPEADTTVKFLYDDTHLYSLFVCREPMLVVAGQRRHQFRAAKTQRDDAIDEDDSAIILLDPTNSGKKVFDFIANARGTVADASCTTPDFWKTRDSAWNSGARAKGHMGDGVWTVEMAIPFSDLGTTPKSGDIWQVGLGRIAKARGEISSWNSSAATVHNPNQLGFLAFRDATPGITLKPPTFLQLGNQNRLTGSVVPISGRPTGLYLSADLTATDAKKHVHQYGFVELGDQSTEVSRTFAVRDEGKHEISYSVLDAGTLRPLIISPRHARMPRSAVAQVKLVSKGAFQLYLNDELIGQGAHASGEQIAAPLQTGANVFALKLEEGTAAIVVQTPGGDKFDGTTWKAAAADTAQATSSSLNDSSWAEAPKVSNDPKLGPIVGRSGQASILRRTLLWENTRVWPTPEPAYYLAKGPAQHFNVIVGPLEGRPLEDWTTYIATPPDFEIVGSSGFYANQFKSTHLGMREVQGRQMQVVKICADKPVLHGRHFTSNTFNAFVRYRDSAKESSSQEHIFYHWSEANHGNVSEPPQSFKVHLLPMLNGVQPKKTFWELWGGWESNLNDQAMRDEFFKSAQAAGFNRLHGGFERKSTERAFRYGLKSDAVLEFNSGSIDLTHYLKEHPNERLITDKGEPATPQVGRQNLMCTSVLLGSGWAAVEGALQKLIHTTEAHMLNYDYEYTSWDGPHSCCCPRCIDAFRDYAKISPDTKLDVGTIKKAYAGQWADFMARRMAQVCQKFKQSIHRLSPGTRFSIYSGYQTPEVVETEGIDWRQIGELQACDMAVCGYGRPVEAIKATLGALKGIPLAGGVIVYPYNTWEVQPASPVTKATVLRTFLDCRGGIMFYDRLPMDGRSWYAIAEVSRLVATHEETFTNGKTQQLSKNVPDFVQALSDGKTTLVCAINMKDTPVNYSFRLPVDAGSGREFYTEGSVVAGEAVTGKLGAGDAAVWILNR